MRILWFAKGENICETEGELPKVGEEVSIRDLRESNKARRDCRYIVKTAHHKVELSTYYFDKGLLLGMTDKERYDSLCNLLAKERQGVLLGKLEAGHVDYAAQSGEVILTTIKE
jgi:hypothetical protein